MTTPDRFFTYRRASVQDFRQRQNLPERTVVNVVQIVWDVYREDWWLGQIVRRPYEYGAGHTWQACFSGWRSWPERRRIDAAYELCRKLRAEARRLSQSERRASSRSNIDCATARPDHAHRMHISSVSHPSAITPNLPDQALLP